MKTITDVLLRVLARLEDENSIVWTKDELTAYIKQGYQQLVRASACIWDMTYTAENKPYCGNYTAPFEADYVDNESAQGRMNFTGGEWERQYTNNGIGPCNHTCPDEENFIDTTFYAAVAELPPETLEVDRVTFDNYRIRPVLSVDMEQRYKYFEYILGPTHAYALDKDGFFVLRKIPVPDSSGNRFPVGGATGTRGDDYLNRTRGTLTTGLGIIFNYVYGPGNTLLTTPISLASPLSSVPCALMNPLKVIGDHGVMRFLPGYFPIGNRGVMRKPYLDTKNVRVEYYRQGKDLDGSEFEIPDRYVKYVEMFTMARAREREGPGQDTKLAAHFDSRFQVGIRRLINRKQTAIKARVNRMGGGSDVQNTWPSRPSLPYHYPKIY